LTPPLFSGECWAEFFAPLAGLSRQSNEAM
jgi:hypothetical protein